MRRMTAGDAEDTEGNLRGQGQLTPRDHLNSRRFRGVKGGLARGGLVALPQENQAGAEMLGIVFIRVGSPRVKGSISPSSRETHLVIRRLPIVIRGGSIVFGITSADDSARSDDIGATTNRHSSTRNQARARSNLWRLRSNLWRASSNEAGPCRFDVGLTSNELEVRSKDLRATSNDVNSTSNHVGVRSNVWDSTSNHHRRSLFLWELPKLGVSPGISSLQDRFSLVHIR
jgi:hypothetical protein